MTIILGSAVKGFALKEAIKAHLTQVGHTIVDVGCYDTSRFITYTSVGERLAAELQRDPAAIGISCCGSGTVASTRPSQPARTSNSPYWLTGLRKPRLASSGRSRPKL